MGFERDLFQNCNYFVFRRLPIQDILYIFIWLYEDCMPG